MSHIHDLARAYNDRIAQSGRDGEIEWIVVNGTSLKLIYTEAFEKRNGLKMRSTAERERIRAAHQEEKAGADRAAENLQSEGFL